MMLDFNLGLGGVLVPLLVILAVSSLRILREYQRGVVFQLGRFWKVKGPGLVLVIPGVQQMVRVDLRVVTMDVEPQDVISRDNVSVKVNAVVFFRVVDPQKAIIQVEDYMKATSELAQTTLRAIHGKSALLEDLRQDVLERTRGNSIFLAFMVGNALQHQPPLGMFKGISTIRSGEHKGKIDLKHTGVVPIVDLARVYALAGGHSAVNTHDRLVSAAAGSAISEQSARDLRDALEFMAAMRIRHQARQMAKGEKPDHHLDPAEISNFERTQLKDAFTVVQSLQSVLAQRYTR
jgi:signal-transduction protein with cAMP-binding, CBS, and nucleotidyltransferase domain